MATFEGYANGSDMLLYVDGSAVGHCTSHSAQFSSEIKERAVKPLASVTGSPAGLWKDKSVSGLSISLTGEGLVFYGETESGFAACLAAWKDGRPVTCKCMRRSAGSTDTAAAWLEGDFVITSLERTDPAGDDATYRISLENAGEPDTLDDTKIEPAS